MTNAVAWEDDQEEFSASEALTAYLEDKIDAAWDREDVGKLLAALADFFWEDTGDEWWGFAFAYHGLRIAADATTEEDRQEFARRFLHHVGMAASFIAWNVEGAELNVLSRITDLTADWSWLDFPGAASNALR